MVRNAYGRAECEGALRARTERGSRMETVTEGRDRRETIGWTVLVLLFIYGVALFALPLIF